MKWPVLTVFSLLSPRNSEGHILLRIEPQYSARRGVSHAPWDLSSHGLPGTCWSLRSRGRSGGEKARDVNHKTEHYA